MSCIIALRNLILIENGHIICKPCHLECLITSGKEWVSSFAKEPPMIKTRGATFSLDFVLCGESDAATLAEALDFGVDLILT